MPVGEGDANGESIDAMGRMSIGITEELKCGITVAFSWYVGLASYGKFSNGRSVRGAAHPSSGHTDVFLYRSIRSATHDHEQRW
jgi:hypothetical protein